MSNNIMCPHCDKEIALEKIQELSISKALKEQKAKIALENNEKLKELEKKQQERLDLERENMKNELFKQFEEENRDKLNKQSEKIETLVLKNAKLQHDRKRFEKKRIRNSTKL